MKVAVYTIITGNYDNLKPITVKNKDVDYIAFVDKHHVCPGWDQRKIKITVDQKWTQRKIKILGFDYLDYDVLIYVDGSFRIKADITELMDVYKGGFLLHQHPRRNNIYDEAIAVMGHGKQDQYSCFEQIGAYQKIPNVNLHHMYETGFMIRDKSTIDLMKLWWNYFKKYPYRDQLSLIPALGEYKPQTLDRDFTNKYLHQYKHL